MTIIKLLIAAVCAYNFTSEMQVKLYKPGIKKYH